MSYAQAAGASSQNGSDKYFNRNMVVCFANGIEYEALAKVLNEKGIGKISSGINEWTLTKDTPHFLRMTTLEIFWLRRELMLMELMLILQTIEGRRMQELEFLYLTCLSELNYIKYMMCLIRME